jgi:hypothetical protein
MKNYNEMAQSVLSRIHEYETAKKRKKEMCIKAAVPICCLCAAIMAGVAIHGAGGKDAASTPQNGLSQSNQNMTQNADSAFNTDETKHAYINGDMLGLVMIDSKEYIQDFTDYVIEETYTADKLLGDAHDFEGTYKTADDTISAELYTVKESKNVLLVKLGNGGTVVLIREGELCVNGKDYMLSDSNGNGEIKETCIGKAKPYIIDVPTRQNNIGSNDILWTVNGDKNKLIAVKPDGTCTVYSTEGKN